MAIQHARSQEQWLYSKIGDRLAAGNFKAIPSEYRCFWQSLTDTLSVADTLPQGIEQGVHWLSGTQAQEMRFVPDMMPKALYDQPYKGDGGYDHVLYIEKNIALTDSLRLDLSPIEGSEQDNIAFLKIAIVVADCAKVTLLLDSPPACGKNSFTCDLFVGQGANLNMLQKLASGNDVLLQHISASVQKDATLNYAIYGCDAGYVRQETNIFLQGQGANAVLHQAMIGKDKNIAEHLACIHHEAPHTSSSQEFYSLADDKALLHVQAKTFVTKQAQKTDSSQLLKGVLLSPQASIFSKPELEIYADDVKCSHGATVGNLDVNALYYLQARGIPKPEAEILLLQAFIERAMSIIPDNNAVNLVIKDFIAL